MTDATPPTLNCTEAPYALDGELDAQAAFDDARFTDAVCAIPGASVEEVLARWPEPQRSDLRTRLVYVNEVSTVDLPAPQGPRTWRLPPASVAAILTWQRTQFLTERTRGTTRQVYDAFMRARRANRDELFTGYLLAVPNESVQATIAAMPEDHRDAYVAWLRTLRESSWLLCPTVGRMNYPREALDAVRAWQASLTDRGASPRSTRG